MGQILNPSKNLPNRTEDEDYLSHHPHCRRNSPPRQFFRLSFGKKKPDQPLLGTNSLYCKANWCFDPGSKDNPRYPPYSIWNRGVVAQLTQSGRDWYFLSAKDWELIVSNSRDIYRTTLTLSKDQTNRIKKDKYLPSLREVKNKNWLEVIVPLHSGEKMIGGARVVSTLDEAQSYLSKKGIGL